MGEHGVDQFDRALPHLCPDPVDPDPVVVAAGQQNLSIRRERHGIQFPQRLTQGFKPGTGRWIVELGRAVVAHTGEDPSVGTEGQSHHRALAAGDPMPLRAVRRRPKPDPIIVAARGEHGAVRGDRDRMDGVALSRIEAIRGAVDHAPAPHLAPRGIPSTGEDPSSIRGEGDGIDPTLEPLQGTDRLPGLDRDQLHLIRPRHREESGSGMERERRDRMSDHSTWRNPGNLQGSGHRARCGGMGPLVDPGSDERDLIRFQMGAFSRGHELVLPGLPPASFQHPDEQGFCALSRQDGGT